MERIRVLIAEDERAVLDALTDLVASDPAMEVVGAATDADEAIRLADDARPDVALVDVRMPGGGGVRATREILRRSPYTHVVALSAYEDRKTVMEMLRAGVVGYMVKGTPAEEILTTIRRSMRGQGNLSVEVTAGVIHELTELLERSEALAGELEELNKTKTELIQILSHELFTPITAIQGFAATLSGHAADMSPEEIQELLEGVSGASGRINRLVGNLSAAAALDRGGVEVTSRPVTAGELVERAASEFATTNGRLRLEEDQDMLGGTCWADLELAARALVVVLENALDLSGEKPVELRIRRRGQELEFSILDRGPGIPEELRRGIFDAFVQGDASTTRSHEGLGIGLYLAQRIMTAHGGRIDAGSREGGGSVFRLSLPTFAPGPA